MLGLAVTYAWLRWRWSAGRAAGGTGWAVAAGALAGLGAITRPVDAICYVAPLALASLTTLRRMPPRARIRTIALTVAGAVPFLALQLVFNVGVTGRLSYTPYQLYLDTQQPLSSYGFAKFDPDAWPDTQLVQKHLYYHQFIRPDLRRHRPENVTTVLLRERLPILAMTTVAHPLLLIVLPVGLLGFRGLPGRGRAAAFFMALPMLLLAYSLNAFLLSHYMVVWMPMIVMLIVLAPRAIERAFPGIAPAVPVTATLLVLAAAVAAQPGINPRATEQWKAPLLTDVRRQLAELPHKPAVVFFRFHPTANFHHEPVYNLDVPWPDDAPVVRAHDLGPRNVELVRYYARRQPERYVYVYDTAERRLHPVGRVDELVRETDASIPHPATQP
jgi:hypothetical protein